MERFLILDHSWTPACGGVMVRRPASAHRTAPLCPPRHAVPPSLAPPCRQWSWVRFEAGSWTPPLNSIPSPPPSLLFLITHPPHSSSLLGTLHSPTGDPRPGPGRSETNNASEGRHPHLERDGQGAQSAQCQPYGWVGKGGGGRGYMTAKDSVPASLVIG